MPSFASCYVLVYPAPEQPSRYSVGSRNRVTLSHMATTWGSSTTCKPQPSRIISLVSDADSCSEQLIVLVRSESLEHPNRLGISSTQSHLLQGPVSSGEQHWSHTGFVLISSHVKILVIRVENNSSWDQAGPVEEQLQQHPRVRIGVLREAHDTRLDTGSKTVTES